MTDKPLEISRREAEVLSLLGATLSNSQIAGRLHISVRTVESHVSSLLRKYGVADRASLASIAGQSPDDTPTPGAVSGLPSPRTTFIGRAHERDSALVALDRERLLVLLGPGGVGKTRLASVVAAAAAPSFPFGGAYVDLVPVGDGFVAQAVAAALRVAESPRQSLLEAIFRRLGGGRFLLVLDNCEHLLDAVAEFVDLALSACPELSILATSRERLAVPGERTVHVAPLPLGSDAEQLFQDRALSGDPEFTADPALVARLCARLDGLPLAIELAAARAASLGADGLLAGLDDSLQLLSGARGAPERHRSLRAVIDWSYGLLEESERALLRQLAVFAGEFDLAAAVAVVPSDHSGSVADLLGRLVEQSMVVHRRGEVSQWRLLETIRTFAMERLLADDEQPDVLARHLRWAAESAAGLATRLDGDWRDDFDAAADDLRAALAGCPSAGPTPVAHQLARSLGQLTYARRFLTESADHYRRAADLAPTPLAAAQDLRMAADVLLVGATAGHQAFHLLLDSAQKAGAAGAGDRQAIALARAVETACRFLNDPAEEIPRERLHQVLDEARACGDSEQPAVQAGLAVAAAWAAGKTWRAPSRDLADLAAAIAGQTGDPVLISAGLDAVSAAAIRSGDLRHAHRVAAERLTLIPTMPRNDPSVGPELVDTLQMAVTYAIAAGDLPAAMSAARLVQTDELIGGHPYAPLGQLTTALVLSGHLEEALNHAPAVWDGWQQAGKPVAPGLAPAILAIALAYGLHGDARAFGLWRARALEVHGIDDIGQATGLAPFAAFVDARVAVQTRQFDDVETLVRRAFGDYPLSRHETYARAAGAELAVIAGLPEATDLLAAAAPAAEQNLWAAACLARAEGRFHEDVGRLSAAVRQWRRLGAGFEVGYTEQVIGDLIPSGR